MAAAVAEAKAEKDAAVAAAVAAGGRAAAEAEEEAERLRGRLESAPAEARAGLEREFKERERLVREEVGTEVKRELVLSGPAWPGRGVPDSCVGLLIVFPFCGDPEARWVYELWSSVDA